jgi:hypothetical protein
LRIFLGCGEFLIGLEPIAVEVDDMLDDDGGGLQIYECKHFV